MTCPYPFLAKIDMHNIGNEYPPPALHVRFLICLGRFLVYAIRSIHIWVHEHIFIYNTLTAIRMFEFETCWFRQFFLYFHLGGGGQKQMSNVANWWYGNQNFQQKLNNNLHHSKLHKYPSFLFWRFYAKFRKIFMQQPLDGGVFLAMVESLI